MKLWKTHSILFSLCLLIYCEKSFQPIALQKSKPPIITTVPPSANLIFVRGEHNNDGDIYFLDTLGVETRLTYSGIRTNPYYGSIVFSPDGSKIAFVSGKEENREIYTINADGTDQQNLTNHPARDEMPRFSPDGSFLLFESNRDGNWEIYSMLLDGNNQTNLIHCDSVDSTPAFSPDGSKIIFNSNRDGDFEVYVMDADGQNQQNLTNFPGGTFYAHDRYPEFSPDGNKIMFISSRELGESLYIMDSNGSNQKFLVNAGEFWGQLFNKVFSHDSKNIIYEQRNHYDFVPGIYIIDIESMENKNLSANPNMSSYDSYPALSPDGTKIVFSSYRNGNSELYEINFAGTAQARLTDNDLYDIMPVYQPVQR